MSNANQPARAGLSFGRVIGIALALMLVFAARASATTYVYWADPSDHAISRANANGSGVVHKFIKHVQSACGLTIEGSYVYWGNLYNASGDGPGTTIGRASLNGTGVDNTFIKGADWPCGVTANASSIFWADGDSQNPSSQPDEDGTIGEANLDGSGVVPALLNIGNSPFGLAAPPSAELAGALTATATNLYWGDWINDSIGDANLDGSGASDDLIGLARGARPEGLTVDGNQLYWAGSAGHHGDIGRGSLDGTGVAPAVIMPPQGGICGIANDGAHLYWTWVNDLGLSGGVARASIAGSGLNEFLTGRSGGVGCGVAVADGSAIPGAPPRARITVVRIRRTRVRVSFSTAGAPATSFQCALRTADARGPFSACTSPKSYTGLAPGRYTFLVRAVGPNGTGSPSRLAFELRAG